MVQYGSPKENVFEVKHEGSLGNQIDFIQVNHNVAYGLFVRWYVESISIEDVAAKKMYVFPCNNWFSETDGDCRQSRLLVNRRSKYIVTCLDNYV